MLAILASVPGTPLSNDKVSKAVWDKLVTTGIKDGLFEGLKTLTIHASRRGWSDTSTEFLYGMTDSVKAASFFISPLLEVKKNWNSDMYWEEQASRAFFKLYLSGTTGILTLNAPTEVKIAVGASLGLMGDRLYEIIVDDPVYASGAGQKLYEMGLYNPDKKFLGIF